jgi:hypothetical protein
MSVPGASLEERLLKYLEITRIALEKVKIVPPSRSFLQGGAEDMLKMAQTYYADALHFQGQGDAPRALAAVSYAHGWIDAGVRLGLLYGGEDDQIFTQFR